MRERKEILIDLICFNENLAKITSELSQYPWDLEKPILIICTSNFLNVLKKCIDEKITFDDLENWASTIECRDDLEFENEVIEQIIFELASPEINEEITKERLKKIIKEIDNLSD